MSWNLSASGHTVDEEGLAQAIGAVLDDPRWGTGAASLYMSAYIGDPREASRTAAAAAAAVQPPDAAVVAAVPAPAAAVGGEEPVAADLVPAATTEPGAGPVSGDAGSPAV